VENKTITDRIWSFFASIKLAIVVFALIALTSIVGTVIEQQAPPEKNLEVLGKIFGYDNAPTLYRIFDSLGFMDMYRSWWFISLLGLFAANLLICSLDRFPSIWKLVRIPIKPLNLEHFKGLPIKSEFSVKGSIDKVREDTDRALRSVGFKPIVSENPDLQLYSEKGRFTRLGVYVTHFSIIIIMLGAILGIFLGFKGGLNLPEGSAYPVAFSYQQRGPEAAREQNTIISALESTKGDIASAASRLGVSEKALKDRARFLGLLPLGFLVKCEDFEVHFYGRSDMPKEYTSLLTIIEGGREVARKWITVNDPLKYKGVIFYQSSYGVVPGASDVEYVFRVGGSPDTIRVHMGEKFSIQGANIEAVVAEFSPALSFDESGRPYTYAETMNNPAVRLEITDGTQKYSKWVLKRYPESGVLSGGQTIEFIDSWGAQYTGLQVRKDPGVWVVYLGCVLMGVGLYVVFFMSHRRLWLSLKPSKGSVDVIIGATANKGRASLEQKVQKITSLLREGGK